MRVTKWLIERYGPTDKCYGCEYLFGFKNYCSHNSICRKSIMDFMKEDDDPKIQEMLDKELERVAGKMSKKQKVEEKAEAWVGVVATGPHHSWSNKLGDRCCA